MLAVDETIVAVASPPRGGERGIVRLSGPVVVDCLQPWFEAGDGGDWTKVGIAKVVPGKVRLDNEGRTLPCDLYLWPTNRSYTKQPTAELHTIGSPPLLQRIVTNACETGARLAQPGEFTLRAFLAGRLDLTQAEAVLGVIDARSDKQLDVALGQLAGGLSTQMHGLRDDLLNLLADLEAGLDFVEEDIAFVSAEEVQRRLTVAIEQVETSIGQMKARAVPTELPRVALIGNPNVGKSSLFNALVGDEAAIVSDTAGTTTDYIRSQTSFAEIPCELIDTAGFEDRVAEGGASAAEQAQQMTTSTSEQATVKLICVDLSRPATAEEISRTADADPIREIVVGTKSDLPRHAKAVECEVEVSARGGLEQGGAGLADLATRIAERLATDQQLAGDTVVSTAVRCRRSLEDCHDSLGRARRLCEAAAGDELVVAELRMALDAIGQVVGVVYTDDVLDRVFSRFCIGK